MRVRVSRNLFCVLAVDIILICCSFYFSHLIRFDFMIPVWAWDRFIDILPFVLIIKLVSFYFFDLYKGMWCYISLTDLMNIVKTTESFA